MNKLSLSRISFIGYVIVVLIFLILPLLVVVPMSFSDSRFLSFPPSSFSFRWYDTFFNNPEWMSAAKTSLIVAFSTALIATPIGVAAAYAINNSSHRLMRHLTRPPHQGPASADYIARGTMPVPLTTRQTRCRWAR
ncbi:hypothetical protein QEN58_13140 [Halomonas alkaliantarctica]|uniref:Spermidine/putrescine transport system permease protein n=1 Tax=Halomonas alkaliantarctica TaxID=232346 RepID=A0ABY8LKA1_9GAMM|nr:hypothetical protein [Halomonas alkaliantarctica]WGI24276.1 hypothetical protein QEN58_13140 [Halomonas alkaliantarctica]